MTSAGGGAGSERERRQATGKDPVPSRQYEVEVVDEHGKPVSGIAAAINGGGQRFTGTTGANGKFRAELAAPFAELSFPDPRSLSSWLDERPEGDTDEPWLSPAPTDLVVELGCDEPSRARARLDPGQAKRVVLHPPYYVRLLSPEGRPIAGVHCTVTIGDRRHEARSDADGWVGFPLGSACVELARVEWASEGKEQVRDFALTCWEGDPQALARARLGNLGYRAEGSATLAEAVFAFQLDHGLAVSPSDGTGDLPEEVVRAIAREWEKLHG